MKKRWVRISLIILIILLLIPIAAYFTLRSSWGQQKVSTYVAALLTKELGVDVSLGRIEFQPMTSLALNDVLILDHHQDTLLSASRAETTISLFELGAQQIHLDEISLSNGLFRLKQYEGEDYTNLQPVIDKLTKSTDTEKQPWDFALNAVHLKNMRLERIDKNKARLPEGRLDPSHLILSEVNANWDDIKIDKSGFSFHSHSLSLRESSGLHIKSLTTMATIGSRDVRLSEMDLQTEQSTLSGLLYLDYRSAQSDSLIIETRLENSRIQVGELGFFVPAYADMNEMVEVDASVSGTLGNLLLKDAKISFGNRSRLYLDGLVKGMPDINALWISADIRRFESDVKDLRHLPIPRVDQLISDLPEAVVRFGAFDFVGDFVGSLSNFNADGRLQTEIGYAEAKMDVQLNAADGSNRYDGFLRLDKIDLGKALATSDLGTASTRIDVSIIEKGRDSQAEIKGLIEKLEFKGYEYRDVVVDGHLQERLFNGIIKIHQPEADLDFKGLVDFRDSNPRFDFLAELYQLNLGALGLVPSMDSTSITGMFKAKFEGKTIDDFEGRLEMKGLSYCIQDDEYFFQDIQLDSKRSANGRLLELHSTPIDVTVDGDFRFAQLKDDFLGLFDDVFPTMLANKEKGKSVSVSDFGYAIQIKDFTQLSELFLPGSHISHGTMISGRLNAERNLFTMYIRADTLSYQMVTLDQINLEMERVSDVAYISVLTEEMTWGDSLRFSQNYYTFNAYRDSLEIDFTWTLPDKDASGSISALSIIHSLDSINTFFYPSQMLMSGDYWLTQGESEILYHNGQLNLSPISLSNGEELISVFGEISKDPNSRLDYKVEDLRLRHLNKFLPSQMTDLAGKMTLDGYATSLLGVPTIVADLAIDDFKMGGELVGNIDLHSTWSRGEEYLLLRGDLEERGTKSISIDGKYFPKAEEDNLDALLNFDHFDLGLLNRLPLGAVSGLGGTATGELTVKGSVLEPDITGDLDFTNAMVHVNYLNTDYRFSNVVKIKKNYIAADYIPFEDQYGNKGNLNGTVIHSNFREWNYDIYAEFQNMLVLNTTAAMNATFFGKVFGTGSVSLSGFDRQLTVEVYGKTEKNTVLEIPLGAQGDVELEQFVYFKRTSEEDSLRELKKNPPTGIDLFIEADITTDADLKLIFDEKIGDVVEGNGQGKLTMTLDKSGVFEMYGNYMISQGEYLFTLQNVVNKRFSVAPGSTVSFFGDPLKAELGLTAIYRVRAPLSDLLPEYGELYSQRTAVDCKMMLDGILFNPDISFEIDFPDLDAGTETLAQSKINTDEELNRQVFSLLILNKFLSSDVASVNDGIAGVSNTGSEFASAQLSNWLSQISDDLDIGVNYRAGDNINSEELAVALSTKLFNDRLLLSGNLGVQGTSAYSTQKNNAVIGDFRLEYFILPDGRLRLKVFSESNDNSVLYLDQSTSKQGVGLVFQKDFDGLFDDFKRIRTEEALRKNEGIQ